MTERGLKNIASGLLVAALAIPFIPITSTAQYHECDTGCYLVVTPKKSYNYCEGEWQGQGWPHCHWTEPDGGDCESMISFCPYIE
jgi:hypothetical protein